MTPALAIAGPMDTRPTPRHELEETSAALLRASLALFRIAQTPPEIELDRGVDLHHWLVASDDVARRLSDARAAMARYQTGVAPAPPDSNSRESEARSNPAR